MEEMRRAVEIMLPKLAAPASAVNMAPAVTWDGECC
jgi:hypothetical protein